MTINFKTFPTPQATAEACGQHVLSVLDAAARGNKEVTLAVSGGSTPKLMFAYMAKAEIDWNKVHLFWVDERGVPPDNADSNYRMTNEHFIVPARIPQRNIHRVKAELEADVAARYYESEIREFFRVAPGELPHFDLLHLGVGPDAHTASLFPGEPLIDDRAGLVGAVYVQKMQQWRITLLPGVLLSARNTAVLISGQDKAEAMQHVVQGAYEPRQFPSQIIAHQARRASWFLDEASATLLA
ncbi:MAG: 6-phosphogluconolactonase [Bryobacteraceae bacterium]|nr:6-phosphogluconolactonase [Bryobacteraceae bacterium]